MAVRGLSDCVCPLPLHWLAIIPDDGVVLKSKEEGSLVARIFLKCTEHMSRRRFSANEMPEQFVHIEGIMHCQVQRTE